MEDKRETAAKVMEGVSEKGKKFTLKKKSREQDTEMQIRKAGKEKSKKGSGRKKLNGPWNKIHFKSIASKIITAFGIAVFLMTVSMVIFAVRAYSYNKSYEAVLDNLTKINYIKTEAMDQPNRFMSHCVGEDDIATSGEADVLKKMSTNLDEISANIGSSPDYAGNQGMVTTVRNVLASYTTATQDVMKAGDGKKFPSLTTKVSDKIRNMKNFNTALEDDALSLMTMELDRSAVVQARIASNFKLMIVICVVIFLAALLISILMCVILTRSITIPVGKLKKEIMIVAKGDLSRQDLQVDSQDEIKAVAEAFNEMSNNIKNILNEVSGVTEEINHSSQVVSKSIAENEQGAEGVAGSLDQMTNQISDQNLESASTLKQMQEMSSVSTKISGGIDQINENAATSMKQAYQGSEQIAQYTQQLAEVNGIMGDVASMAEKLNDSTKEMNEILSSITEISSQTRLLSLNASIEAARAGEAGRGFAVVASEIGNLANDTQESTSKITDIIDTVQQDVTNMTARMKTSLDQLKKSNSMAEQTKESFAQIASGTEVVSANIEEIQKEIQDMTGLVDRVSESMKHIDGSVEKNKNFMMDIAATVSEQNANLDEISGTAESLTRLAEKLNDMLSKFKLSQDVQEI